MERLRRLINDLLDLSKIEAGKMELYKVSADIMSILKESVDSIAVVAEKNGIKLRLAAGNDIPPFDFDKDRITQVVINLIANALKFTPEGGTILVKCELKDEKEKDVSSLAPCPSSFVEVSVSDTGPGMTQEQANMLFDRFKQLVTPQAVKGTGLGLAISKAIVEMHGGRIWVESEMGKGSCFKFTLPA
jgi:signal transduction histidine kinase